MFLHPDIIVWQSNPLYLQNIKNAVSVAQKVMTETPHVILSGKGAEQFALDQGFSKEDLLTEETKAQYQKWILEKKYKPVINIENHDTIGMVGLSPDNNLAGACSTSGLAYKMNGRVGDSPIIGAGLFVDNEIGACTATGLGEIVLKNLCSFLVVELMRNGHSPDSACKLALERVLKKEKSKPDYQIGLIAINKAGDFGAYAVFEGFKMAICKNNELLVEDSKYFYKYD